jgi:hypothetical protein
MFSVAVRYFVRLGFISLCWALYSYVPSRMRLVPRDELSTSATLLSATLLVVAYAICNSLLSLVLLRYEKMNDVRHGSYNVRPKESGSPLDRVSSNISESFEA